MSRSISLGMMQGRLSDKVGKPLQSFPYNNWQNEFLLANQLGLDQIEWLLDGIHDKQNPLASESGRAEIKKISENNNVRVNSLCAHKFIDGALIDNKLSDYAFEELLSVLDWSRKLHIDHVILPLMDSMSLDLEIKKEKLKEVLNCLNNSKTPIILLESDLNAIEIKNFIETLDNKKVKVLFDLGNATALGFNIKEELTILNDMIGEIHIKDRFINGGKSTRLGCANTNFNLAAKTLSKLSWMGPVVLETPIFENSYIEAKKNIFFTKKWIDSIIS